MSTVSNTASTSSTSSTSSTDSNSGNSDLQAAFNTALASAQKTLIISTIGNANLNALRARPN